MADVARLSSKVKGTRHNQALAARHASGKHKDIVADFPPQDKGKSCDKVAEKLVTIL